MLGQNVILNTNGTITPLGAGSTFTGTFFDVTDYQSAMISVMCDQAGTLLADFSPDGVNVDSTLTFKVLANDNAVHRLICSKKFFRVRFINTAASPQTVMRLQVKAGMFDLLTSPLNQITKQDADSVISKSIDTEFLIARGLISGVTITNKFGRNPDVDLLTTPEDIWESGGVYTGFPDITPETVSVLSSSASDTAAGTGSRTVRITGLDSNYVLTTEIITLNGTTPVASVNTYRRVHSMTCLTAGSGGVNAGSITARYTTTTSVIFVVMSAGFNQTNCSGFTIPAGVTGYMKRLHGSLRGLVTAAVDGGIWTRPFGSVFRQRRPFSIGSESKLDDTIFGGLVFTEKTDIIIRITAASASNLDVVAGYDLILVEN